MAASNSPAEQLITENIDIWTSTIKKRGSQGRGSSKKIELYGIKKLRELILELAVRGLLVPQDPNDEPASVLLEKIAAEKEQLIKDGKIKKQQSLPPIGDDEKPFKLPNGWELKRLGYLTHIFAGNSFRSGEFNEISGTRVIKITNAGVSELIETEDYLPAHYSDEYENYRVIEGDLILALTRPYISSGLKVSVCPSSYHHALLNQRVAAIRAFSNTKFIYQYMQSKFVLGVYRNRFGGSGLQPNLKMSDVTELVMPIPPEAEQPRIVAKVDELMALCDQLEQQTESSLLAHQTLIETLLNTLLNADQNSFDQAWERIAQHFDVLFTTEHSIDQLKQTILQLAVMGKLVPQDPNDEPASVLLEKIATEKEQLIKDKVIKKQKPLPPISEDEKPFGLPKGWEWSRLSDVLDVRDGTHDSPKDASGGNTYPLVTSKNFCNGEINFSEARQISEKDHLEISKRSLVEVGDILFSMIGGNLGNQVIVKDPRAFSIKNVALLKYYLKSATQPEYIKVFTEELAIELQNKASGGAQPFVSLGALRKLVFALPPFDEQHRIVAKVDGLMSLCDNLKLKISESQTTQLHLADAMAEQALN